MKRNASVILEKKLSIFFEMRYFMKKHHPKEIIFPIPYNQMSFIERRKNKLSRLFQLRNRRASKTTRRLLFFAGKELIGCLFVNGNKMGPDKRSYGRVFPRHKQRNRPGRLGRHMAINAIFFDTGNPCGIDGTKTLMLPVVAFHAPAGE